MQIKSKSFFLLAVAILLFSNCAIYYFSAKHLEPGKYEIGLGGNKSFQKEYSISNGINFLNDGLWTAPPIYIYLKTGLPKEYNLSFGLTSNYAVTGLTAVVSKRVKQFMEKNSEISLGAGGTMFIVPKQFWETPEPEDINKITPDFVNWGIHFSINYFKSMKYGDISLKCVFEYQHSDSILTYDYAASSLYDKISNIFFLAFETEIGKSLNIMPYISIVVGIDPFNRNNVYYGGIAGITFFFRTK